MLDTVLIHRRSDTNIGDQACTPGHYFDFGHHDIMSFGQEAPACTRAVLGGGQVYDDCVEAAIYQTSQARHRVVWGVGISPKNVADFSFDILEGSCSLISSRNWNVPRCDYVPCPSAMSPLFDNAPPPVHDVVIFSHATKSQTLARCSGMPEMTNHDASMADAIAFLASGETVVTNSFHGTYWAMCLGRKVICVPFNHKFRQFKANPVFADPGNWIESLGQAERRLGTLEDARARNKTFYEKVMNLS
ncbi:MAG: hypothetical protein ACSHXB_08235 [Sulfitobacter sp.]